MTRTADTARIALRETREFVSHRGSLPHTFVLYYDPHRPGACVWVMTPGEVLPLTVRLLGSLTDCDLLLLGRFEVTDIVDRTTIEFGTVIGDDDPIRRLDIAVILTAHPAAISAVHHVTLTISHESEEWERCVVLSALQHPEGWPP